MAYLWSNTSVLVLSCEYRGVQFVACKLPNCSVLDLSRRGESAVKLHVNVHSLANETNMTSVAYHTSSLAQIDFESESGKFQPLTTDSSQIVVLLGR
jgi:hypothetical protein